MQYHLAIKRYMEAILFRIEDFMKRVRLVITPRMIAHTLKLIVHASGPQLLITK